MKKHLHQIALRIDRHEIFVMSAALAYATALALAPFILIILSLLSVLGRDIQDQFSIEMGSSLGPEFGDTVKSVMKNVNSNPDLSGISSVLGFAVLLISASAIFTQLRIAIDKINEYKDPENVNTILFYFRNKFLSLGLVLGFAFLSIVSLMATAFISIMYPTQEAFYLKVFAFLINYFIFSFLFTAIYRYVPTDRLSWKKSFIAGSVSTVFYLIGKGLISLYLGKAGLGSLYGAAGSLIVFLAWVYYTALTLLLSYEVSAYAFNNSASKIETELLQD